MSDKNLLIPSNLLEQKEDILERYDIYAIKVVIGFYAIEFEVSLIAGEHISGGTDVPSAWLYESTTDGELTSNFDHAERFLSGTIKWDGCSDWFWHDTECMMHLCGRKRALGIGQLLDHLYQIAKERLPDYNKSLAED